MKLKRFPIVGKKIYFILFFVILFSLTLSASLLDVYKSGEIKLVPDPNFGKGTDWDIYFPQGIKDIAFAKDGSFFATGMGNKACHCIYKFDRSGKFVKKIGRKGRGPGDLYHPGALSILDNKYLLVAEYATNRRISVFDLNGNFVKIIKTRDDVYDVVGLKNNKIAILTNKYGKSNKQFSDIYYMIIIKDLKNNNEKKIQEYRKREVYSPYIRFKFSGNVYMFKTKNNDLFLSFDDSNEYKIYSAMGVLLKKTNLKYRKRIINKKEKEKCKKSFILNIKKSVNEKFLLNLFNKNIDKVKYPKEGGYFDDVIVDSEYNILFLKRDTNCLAKEINVEVYNNEGERKAKFKVIKKNNPEFFFSQIKLYKNYIYYYDNNKRELIREKIDKE